ncbi:unnamed protein product [Calicophoron daubneyi]|uniref:Uncharacterized protein n=1 Tax=Calicophoron daubneyi TaxID=300641 RepID=A0AAV2TER1_CALDB
MSAVPHVRPVTSSGEQIWPPVSLEDEGFLDLSNKDVVWDDSELIAHYDRVDAFVKKKVNAIYQQRIASSKPAKSTTISQEKFQPSDNRRSSSCSRDPSSVPSKAKEKQPPSRSSLPRSQRSANAQRPIDHPVYSHPSDCLEAALQSTRPTNVLPCDFEWLPPLLYPPDELFRPKSNAPPQKRLPLSKNMTSLPLHSNPPPLPSQPVSNPLKQQGKPLTDVQETLYRWFQAGYNLGRDHGTQVKKAQTRTPDPVSTQI